MPSEPAEPTRLPRDPVAGFPATATLYGSARDLPRWNLPRLSILVAAGLMWLLHMMFVGFDLARFFFSIVVVPATIGALVILVWSRPWAYLVGGILVLLFPAVAILGGALTTITDPSLGMESIANLIALLLLATAVPATIIGFMQARRRTLRPLAAALRGSGHGLYSWIVLALFVGAVSQSVLATNAASDVSGSAYDLQPTTTVDVVMEDLEFQPKSITLSAGDVHLLRVQNEDTTFHTFTYMRDGVEYNHDILAGGAVEFLVLFEQSDTYTFWCTPHSEGSGDSRTGMVGTFEIT